MKTLKDSIIINKPPDEVFEWLSHFVENYRAWHPDHVMAKWKQGSKFEENSILYAEEYLNGKLEKLSFKMVRFVPGRFISYKMLFPESMICKGGTFQLEKHNGGSLFTATLTFRWAWFLSRLFPVRIKAIRQHMKEEGENLKNLLEAS